MRRRARWARTWSSKARKSSVRQQRLDPFGDRDNGLLGTLAPEHGQLYLFDEDGLRARGLWKRRQRHARTGQCLGFDGGQRLVLREFGIVVSGNAHRPVAVARGADMHRLARHGADEAPGQILVMGILWNAHRPELDDRSHRHLAAEALGNW